MQRQQRLFILLIVFKLGYATEIQFFDANDTMELATMPNTIFSNWITLYTNVTDCPPPFCQCNVTSNATDDDIKNLMPIMFLGHLPSIGSASFFSLQPDTLYSFTITCVGANETITRNIRTDYDQPSPPQNITIQLISTYLRISWSPPVKSGRPIVHYELSADQRIVDHNISNSQFSYDMKEHYVYGENITLFLQACTKDIRDVTICSKYMDGQASFFLPKSEINTKETTKLDTKITTTTTRMITTTQSSVSSKLSISTLLLFKIIFFVYSSIK